uniref:Sm domain-containing protein n=1 Tax=Ciona intestinalis TaxID=7719 RepID=H2Y1I9_CIOIN
MAASSREKFYANNTLAVLLIAMENNNVRVETKNESLIKGRLINCDGFGNLNLINATIINVRGTKIKVDEIYIKASSVRYVQLPSKINPIEEIEKHISRSKQRKPQMPAKYKKEKT